MTQIVVRGFAAVFREGVLVTDPAILHTLAGLGYEDDVASTLTPPDKIVLAGALKSGAVTRFEHREGDPLLTVEAEYRSRRPLSQPELRALLSYTLVLWGDEIGADLTHCPIHDEYDILCLGSRAAVEEWCPTVDVGAKYPTIELTERSGGRNSS